MASESLCRHESFVHEAKSHMPMILNRLRSTWCAALFPIMTWQSAETSTFLVAVLLFQQLFLRNVWQVNSNYTGIFV
jgi:hypothetical protein